MTAYLPNGCLKANNFDILLYALLSHRPFHMATAFSRCHLSLAFGKFLQDLDPFLAYKVSSVYLLSFVLDISNEKRQGVKELIDLKNRLRLMSRNLYI